MGYFQNLQACLTVLVVTRAMPSSKLQKGASRLVVWGRLATLTSEMASTRGAMLLELVPTSLCRAAALSTRLSLQASRQPEHALPQ